MKKKFAILFVMILSIFSFYNICFAIINYDDINDVSNLQAYSELCEHLSGDDYNYFLYIDYSSNEKSCRYWYFFNDYSDLNDSYFRNNTFYFPNINHSHQVPRVYVLSDNNRSFYDVLQFTSWNDFSLTGSNIIINDCISNFDIKFNNTSDNFTNIVSFSSFFQSAPQSQEIQEGSIAEIVQKVENKDKVLQEIVGLLPVILLVIIGLIALRKALQMLVTFLRRS